MARNFHRTRVRAARTLQSKLRDLMKARKAAGKMSPATKVKADLSYHQTTPLRQQSCHEQPEEQAAIKDQSQFMSPLSMQEQRASTSVDHWSQGKQRFATPVCFQHLVATNKLAKEAKISTTAKQMSSLNYARTHMAL